MKNPLTSPQASILKVYQIGLFAILDQLKLKTWCTVLQYTTNQLEILPSEISKQIPWNSILDIEKRLKKFSRTLFEKEAIYNGIYPDLRDAVYLIE